MTTEVSVANTDKHRSRTRRRPYRFLVAVGILFTVLVLGGAYAWWQMMRVPADLDLATTKLSAQGLYEITMTPQQAVIPINRMHTWTLRVTQPDGRPVEQATITVDGDMPQHGHGLPTQPQVTQNLGDGDYLVEGMKFQMGGWWVVDFVIEAEGQRDTVRFNLVLE